VTTGDDEGPPAWAGAPAYVPHPELPPPVNEPPVRTGFLPVLGAAVVWALVDVLLVLVVLGPPAGAAAARLAAGLALTAAVTAAAVWALARRRAWSFGLLLLATAPVFWILLAIVSNLLG
jgi:hypothetical protein